MHFTAFFAILPALSALAAKIDDGTCASNGKYVGWWHNQFSYAGCADLARDCESTFLSGGSHDPWNIKSCVATATCWGPKELNTRLQCRDASYEPASAPALNKDNIYQPIVGDCDGDCSMTFDDFAQFISSSLSDVGSSGSPPSSDDLRANYWSYITDYTATEDVSYTDFNDWLFKSNA